MTAFRNRACSFQAHNFVFCQNGNCLNRVVDGKRTYRNRWVWKQVLCIVNWTDLRGNGDGLQISKYIAPYNSARKPRGGSKSTQKGPKVSGLTYKSRAKWKMLWGYIVPSRVTSSQMWKVCWNKRRLRWKIEKLFYFSHLKKLVRPETFGPYNVCLISNIFWTLGCIPVFFLFLSLILADLLMCFMFNIRREGWDRSQNLKTEVPT